MTGMEQGKLFYALSVQRIWFYVLVTGFVTLLWNLMSFWMGGLALSPAQEVANSISSPLGNLLVQLAAASLLYRKWPLVIQVTQEFSQREGFERHFRKLEDSKWISRHSFLLRPHLSRVLVFVWLAFSIYSIMG